ncbi:EAL domain-containing protein [Paenibacillus sp. alder61]|nr:EAL domain-containing protein [Paenibacillus faecis]MCA1294884.1 EAL domain-containing protein [Paenibacillus sp. alder61]
MKRIVWMLVFAVIISSSLSLPAKGSVSRHNVTYYSELDYPPFKFNQHGYPSGFDLELTRLIFEDEKYSLYYTFSAWNSAYAKLVNGEVDTVGLMAVTEERERDILFSNPVMRTYTGIYAKPSLERNEPVTPEALSNFKVGVAAGQYTERQLKEEAGLSEFLTFPTVEEGIKALRAGTIDLLFENQHVVNYLIVKEGLTEEIRQVAHDLYPVDIAYGVSKGNPELVDYLNRRIGELRGESGYEALYQRYFFVNSEFYADRIRNNYMALAILAVLLVAISYILLKLYINRLRRTIRGEREFSRDVLDHANLFVWAVQGDKTTVRINAYAEQLTGIREQDAVGVKYDELPEIRARYGDLAVLLDEALSMKFVENREMTLIGRNGAFPRAFLFRTSVIHGLSGVEDVFIVAGMDIQERKIFENKLQNSYEELEAIYEQLAAAQEELRYSYEQLLDNQDRLRRNEERYRLVTEASNGGIWEIDLVRKRHYYSPRWFELLGYTREDEVTSEMLENIVHPDDIHTYELEMTKAKGNERSLFECEYRLRMKNGEYRWFLARGKIVYNEAGEPYRLTGSISDIHELKLSQERLLHLAYHDELSDLPNRLYLLQELESFFAGPRRKAALFFVDTDNFKYINDTLGHKFGDRVLREASSRLASLIAAEEAMLFRLGGDEFVILQKDIDTTGRAILLAERLLEGFKTPFHIDGSDLYISISIGISFYPQHGTTPEEILKNADVAMYAAKEAGKGKYMIFDPAFLQAFNDRVLLEKHLRQGLSNEEFLLYYQPQVSLKTGKVIGFEALIRWNSPELGFVSPLTFIKVAEDSRLIVSIGEWVILQACRFAKRLQNEGLGHYKIAVNISVVQLQQEDFVDKVMEALSTTGLAPQYLELEITESTIIESFDRLIPNLTYLRAQGIQIALDDFGTGYSSLGYLKQMPITTLKIDKTFIEQVPAEDDKRSLARAIVLIGRKMGLQVIAEGVETDRQIRHVKRSKCDVIQGYYISKPLPEEEAVALIRSDPAYDIGDSV